MIIRVKTLEEKVDELEKNLKAMTELAWSFSQRLNLLEQDHMDRVNQARRLSRYGKQSE